MAITVNAAVDAAAVMVMVRPLTATEAAEPVPEILAAMGEDALDAAEVAARLAAQFDFDAGDAEAIVGARLEELALLGLVERLGA